MAMFADFIDDVNDLIHYNKCYLFYLFLKVLKV